MSLLPGVPPPVGQGDPAGGSVDVLVVDDDEDIRVSLDRGLRLSGFSVLTVADGPAALRVVAARSPRCIVLDVDLPGLSGVDVVASLRQREIQTPVCMLSALATVDDRVAGLAAGADDYLVKPFALSELVARLRALLRRVPDQPAHRFAVGVLTLDTGERTATVAGRAIDLTKREFELLEVLVRHPRMVLSREQLLSSVWGYEFAVDTNVVDVFVGYLRRKLESGGEARMVHTVRGVGFVLRPPA